MATFSTAPKITNTQKFSGSGPSASLFTVSGDYAEVTFSAFDTSNAYIALGPIQMEVAGSSAPAVETRTGVLAPGTYSVTFLSGSPSNASDWEISVIEWSNP